MRTERQISPLSVVLNLLFTGLFAACNSLVGERSTPGPDTPVVTPKASPTPEHTKEPTPFLPTSVTVNPTPTPNFEALQALKPENIDGMVVMTHGTFPELLVDLPTGYEAENVAIARWEGEWKLAPFSLIRDAEGITEILNSQENNNYLYNRDSGIINNSFIYNIVSGQLLGMSVDVDDSNQAELTWIMAYRGRVYKIKPDVFVVGANNGAIRTEYDTNNLNVETVFKLISYLDSHYPEGNAVFNMELDSIAEGGSFEEVEPVCRAYGPKFLELCKNLAEDNIRIVDSLAEMNNTFDLYGVSPTSTQISKGDFWWDDELFKPFPQGVISSGTVILLEG